MTDSIASPILVTGGRGVLAAALARYFREQGREVVTFSRTPGDGHHALEELFADAWLERTETLLHLAWSTLPFSAENSATSRGDEDVALLTRLLERVRCVRGARPHFVFFSSGGTVYGDAVANQPSCEEDVCRPRGRHGRAKLAAENLVLEQAKSHGFSTAVLRISNPYGYPVPRGRPQGIIPIAIQCARSGTPLTLWGDGTARKDFLHFADFAAAMDMVVARRLQGIYNVASGQSHTLQELLAIIEQATGRPITIRREDAHPWDVHDSLLDNTRFCQSTGWKPTVPLAEGVRRVVQEIPA